MRLSYYQNLALGSTNRLGLVWNLFAQLGKMSVKSIIANSRYGDESRLSFSDSLIRSATTSQKYFNNRDGEDFNILGYDYVVRHYDKIAKFKKLEKEVFLVGSQDNTSSKDELQVGYGEVNEDKVLVSQDDTSSVEDKLDYLLAWQNFGKIQKIVERKGYQLDTLLLLAIQGNKQAIATLSDFSKEEYFADWLCSILLPEKLEDVVFRLEGKREVC